MKRKWAGWLSTYSFLLHFRFSPLPQFSVYFSCENPVGSKDVLGITRKWVKSKRTFGIKMAQELLWDIWGSIKLEPNVYFWKCLEQWKKIKSYKYLKYLFCYFRFPSVPQWPVPLWEPPMYSGPLALRWLQGTVIQNQ